MTQAAIIDAEIANADEDTWIASVPPPAQANAAARAVFNRLDCVAHLRAASRAVANHQRANEGASFLKVAPDVELIVVRGAQPLHHDRHMSGVLVNGRRAEHTWNYVLESDEDQLLLVETAQDCFTHITLEQGVFAYFNTLNRHLVSRSNPMAQIVIAQVIGYSPNESEMAAERLREVLADL